ncbi:MAG TPA: protein kinase [Streptosporangiaceae bacterium]
MSAFNSVLDDRYLLTRKIGVGGFSEVWSGHDQVLDRPVAVKLLHVGLAGHEEALQRFGTEARHAGLVSHENVARIYDFGAPAPQHPPYLVMELVQGESLQRALEREGAISARRTLEVIEQTAAGLQAAHEAGLIHRDIKPGNLLLSESGVVKVTDFGISQAAGSVPLTLTGMIVGSPGYLAPERACGARATVAADLYSLGIVAYECLSGTRPFSGSMLEVALAHRDCPLPPLPPSVPPEVAVLVGKLTAKVPGDRPADAAEVAARAAELRVLGTSVTAALPRASDGVWAGVRAGAGAGAGTGAGAGRQRPSFREPGWAVFRRLSWRRRVGKKFVVGMGTGAAVTALVGALTLILLGTSGRQAGADTASTNSQSLRPAKNSQVAAARVDVDRRALIGEPIWIVRAKLERHHLTVLVRWRVTAAQPPGRVVAVNPAGKLSPDAVVTVTGAQAPAIAPPGRRRGHQPPGHDPSPPGRGQHRGGPDGPPGQDGSHGGNGDDGDS